MMGRIREYLKHRFSRSRPTLSEEAAEQLRVDFKDRYHHFKLLLSANKHALEKMAEIEGALRGGGAFGMTFVRSVCTEVAASVMRMIRYMKILAPDKYPELLHRFKAIQEEILTLLEASFRPHVDSALVVPLSVIDHTWREQTGGKMANLGELHRHTQLIVPDGFVITTAAYMRFMAHSGLQDEIDRLLQVTTADDTAGLLALSSRIQQVVRKAPIPPDLASAIGLAWKALAARHGTGFRIALRSSSLFEDSEAVAFAGQFKTELNISQDHLLTSYREVVASKYSLQALTYRLRRGIRDEDLAVAVGAMVMVDAVTGGVAYSVNPVDPADRSVHIDAAWGLPKTIVDGSAAFDSFTVDRSPEPRLSRQTIRHKRDLFVCNPEDGVCQIVAAGEMTDRPCLTPEQAVAVARVTLDIEAHYSRPQDIEWALTSDGRVTVLQCRPLSVSAGEEGGMEPPATVTEADVLLEGGVTASPGAGSGPVFLADRYADAPKFPSGAVLVVRQAAPHWATLIGRASAVVSEQGGFAGHLANVAREFGVPALFGCADAMVRLAADTEVTLDADRRKVYAGIIEGLQARPPKAINPMVDSPVYQLLKKLDRLIVPLNLLDPTAREFHAKNCRTLHDITRFLHEKSVQEMFNFGKDHQFPERSSKQLFFEVPMQWWVLNLDDGFKEEVDGKYVHLENIASEPMRAFWEGFTAIPWAGPPPIDHRGLASVLFQSTANTALTTGRQSRYAEKNYFMISRHYCNLSSRLGYHFATLEALVSERAPENYITFQFKGGAADIERRLRRVHFIAELLENYAFRVTTQEDHLTARIDNDDCEFMYERLKILGYFSLHTRQIDMVMKNSARVNALRKKMLADIDGELLDPASAGQRD
ncbi:phosphoenolpyruvate synthase [Desulfosarcina alkanivorans]|uniref:Phosphoenolpyruvate synthase n=1 Tax=Desulfosarcina alkanivorans TaxID=571177 RepID=A0A5K7Z190_9BACT|nr:PEP/pyruvate-binding domain-containing protein [Desulfosarcina alkanivorans]BBO72254.1 phosphoenolpyruvate synthase [Desulfosarcina alkanivorans]